MSLASVYVCRYRAALLRTRFICSSPASSPRHPFVLELSPALHQGQLWKHRNDAYAHSHVRHPCRSLIGGRHARRLRIGDITFSNPMSLSRSPVYSLHPRVPGASPPLSPTRLQVMYGASSCCSSSSTLTRCFVCLCGGGASVVKADCVRVCIWEEEGGGEEAIAPLLPVSRSARSRFSLPVRLLERYTKANGMQRTRSRKAPKRTLEAKKSTQWSWLPL